MNLLFPKLDTMTRMTRCRGEHDITLFFNELIYSLIQWLAWPMDLSGFSPHARPIYFN